jgi:hypothetical protein
MNTKHTPGPYRYDETWAIIYGANGAELAACHSSPADAAFIVRACNAHDDLVAVLEDLLCCTELNLDDIENSTRRTIETAVAVIAKAKG